MPRLTSGAILLWFFCDLPHCVPTAQLDEGARPFRRKYDATFGLRPSPTALQGVAVTMLNDPLIHKAYSQLSTEDRLIFDSAYRQRSKSVGVAYLTWLIGWQYAYFTDLTR